MTDLSLEIEAEHLRDFISVPLNIIDEAILSIKEDGIRMRSVDSAHVCMVDIQLSKDIFESFNGPEKEIGIQLKKLDQFLKLVKNEKVTVKENDSKLWVQGGNFDRHIPTLDTAGISEPSLPDYDFQNRIVIKGKQYKKAIKAAGTVSDNAIIRSGKGYFEIESEEDEDDILFNLAKEDVQKLEISDECQSMYNLDYLKFIAKEISSSENLQIDIGEDYPARLRWFFSEGHGESTVLVAPRIDGTELEE